MRKPDRSTYTSIDFIQWREAKSLVISPKFQRRGVWGRPARSYLIDTMLLGLPIPPLYIRVIQDPANKKVVREVIDGQQRVSAVLDYVDGKYALGKNIESPCVGKKYEQLSLEQQQAISQYSFICEVFYGVEDRDILKVFARLNTHSVKLNSQELRNGKFFGEFKSSAYTLAVEHLEFWRRKKIFSEQAIARMHEVELTSELMILAIDGLQDKKKSIDDFYRKLDEQFEARVEIEKRFRGTIDTINEALTVDLSETEFTRTPLFYSLFGAVYHRLYGIPKLQLPGGGKGHLSETEREQLDAAVRNLSETLELAKSAEASIPPDREAFVTACLRQTDNVRPRTTRLSTIYYESFGAS